MDLQKVLTEYLAQKGLKNTSQRKIILQEFLDQASHLSTEELYLKVRSKHPGIGYATVHRTLKLFAECGIAVERNFGDGQGRFELTHGEEHHDHLICNRCGMIIEFENPQIEKLQEQVAVQHNFVIENHRLELYGLCSECVGK
ncbi:MAG: transcriptional repressor [Desulfuromonadales bacterium]|nr:transcriptional repressor [Desulfuromonadales bacterium]